MISLVRFSAGLLVRFGPGMTLSTMMRVRGLTRCLWRGWESFQSYVWASIISENLLRIAQDLAKREAKAEASG